MMILPSDISSDSNLGRRVLAVARTIAPCLNSLDGEAQADAIAILKGVAAEAAARGVRSVAHQGVGSASVTYSGGATSWFQPDDRAALRSLCAEAAQSGGHPVGQFPRPDRSIRKVWPECEEPV